jgi:hypothetical protein
MIRIDEIYYNVYAKGLQHKSDIALHWFDPFGSVDIKDLCNFRPLTEPRLRLIFWDQEPVYRDTGKVFFEQFNKIYHPDFGKKILVTSEKNSRDLDWLCDTYGLDRAYYFFHGWAALDWYRGYDHSFLSTDYFKRDIRYPLFIPNNIIGGRRQHRVQLLAALHQRDSIRQNRISFPEICPHENISAQQLAQEIEVDISGLKLPLIIDHGSNHADGSHNIDFWAQAQECFCHVVTETAWNGRLHITEKTFKPIVMQQPFILIGSRHGLSYLREYGFKTFGDIWDESYDSLPDSRRMEAVSDLCATISSWSPAQLEQAHLQSRPIVEHNFRWFYSGFQDVLWQELNVMMDQWR